VTDGGTDRIAVTYNALVCIASRGRNYCRITDQEEYVLWATNSSLSL